MITKTINVTFTSNYELGCHRICYTVTQPGQAPAYTCQTVNCDQGTNVSCNASIQLELDDTSCSPVTITGYVQACCQDESSLEGRVPFEIVYDPENACYVYNLTCDCGQVVFNIIDGGTGYLADQFDLYAGSINNVNGTDSYDIFVDTNSNGEIINMYTSFSGCSNTIPVLDFQLIPDEGGTPANIQVRVRCNETSVNNLCSTVSGNAFIPPFDLGTSFNLCSQQGITINNQYVVTGPDGCCTGCETVSVNVATRESVIFWGVGCDGNIINEFISGPDQKDYCVKQGHYGLWNDSQIVTPSTITVLRPC
jgi:hypothetical protein